MMITAAEPENITNTPTTPASLYAELREEIRASAADLHRLPGLPTDASIEVVTEEMMSLCATVWFIGQAAGPEATNPFIRPAA
jgi:hypothetical protein